MGNRITAMTYDTVKIEERSFDCHILYIPIYQAKKQITNDEVGFICSKINGPKIREISIRNAD
jgi:hypothetical protein